MSLSCRRSREDVSTHPPAGVRGLHEAVTGVSPTCCPGGLSHTTLSGFRPGWEPLLMGGKGWKFCSKDRAGGEEPPVARVMLLGHPGTTASP